MTGVSVLNLEFNLILSVSISYHYNTVAKQLSSSTGARDSCQELKGSHFMNDGSQFGYE